MEGAVKSTDLKFWFLKWPFPAAFSFYVRCFQTVLRDKTFDFSGIWTRIIKVEGEHTDHLTTTTTSPKWIKSWPSKNTKLICSENLQLFFCRGATYLEFCELVQYQCDQISSLWQIWQIFIVVNCQIMKKL